MTPNKNLLKRLQMIREDAVNKCYRGDKDGLRELQFERLKVLQQLNSTKGK